MSNTELLSIESKCGVIGDLPLSMTSKLTKVSVYQNMSFFIIDDRFTFCLNNDLLRQVLDAIDNKSIGFDCLYPQNSDHE